MQGGQLIHHLRGLRRRSTHRRWGVHNANYKVQYGFPPTKDVVTKRPLNQSERNCRAHRPQLRLRRLHLRRHEPHRQVLQRPRRPRCAEHGAEAGGVQPVRRMQVRIKPY